MSPFRQRDLILRRVSATACSAGEASRASAHWRTAASPDSWRGISPRIATGAGRPFPYTSLWHSVRARAAISAGVARDRGGCHLDKATWRYLTSPRGSVVSADSQLGFQSRLGGCRQLRWQTQLLLARCRSEVQAPTRMLSPRVPSPVAVEAELRWNPGVSGCARGVNASTRQLNWEARIRKRGTTSRGAVSQKAVSQKQCRTNSTSDARAKAVEAQKTVATKVRTNVA